MFQVRKDPELCPHVDKLVHPSIDYMLTLQFPSGNFPAVVGDKDDRLVHWCHGAPGWTSMWALAYQVTSVFPNNKPLIIQRIKQELKAS